MKIQTQTSARKVTRAELAAELLLTQAVLGEAVALLRRSVGNPSAALNDTLTFLLNAE